MAIPIQQILRIYDKRISGLSADNIADYASAQKYAQKTGKILADVINQFADVSTMTEADAISFFSTVLKHNHDVVQRACRRAQRAINNKARITLGLLDAEFDTEAARNVARMVVDASEVTPAFVKNLVVNNSNHTVDESIRLNTQAHSEIGLAVHITRKYDDVGLHGGKDVCRWCLDREGDWTDYLEAYNAGVFERHPGCGCVITYEVGKTRTWSGAGWNWNALEDIGQ